MSGTYYQRLSDEDGDPASIPAMETVIIRGINAPGGRISMVSAASPGEVIPTPSGLDASSVRTKGHITLSEKSEIDISGQNRGRVDIQADTLSLSDGARISGETYGAADGGTIVIEAREIDLTNGGLIGGSTSGSGAGGNIVIRAGDKLAASGRDETDPAALPSGIFTDSNSDESDAGHAGRIEIEAGEISVSDSAQIRGVTFGPAIGGTINAKAEKITLTSGGRIRTCSLSSGDSGTIEILSDSLTVVGDAGNLPTGVFSNSLSNEPDSGKAGEVKISAEQVIIDDQGGVSAFNLGGGDAGHIDFKAGEIRLTDNAEISSVSQGGGGSITLEAEKRIWLSDSEITNSIRYGADETEGSFRIDSEFVILNHSLVRTGVQEGAGGDIHIRANFISSSDSRVDASGQLTIESPDTDVSGDLMLMPKDFIDAARWAVIPCSQRSGEDVSRFEIRGRDGIAISFEDFRPSPLIFPNKGAERKSLNSEH